MKAPTPARRLVLVPLALCAVFAGGAVARVQDVCGPFTDVSPSLCPYVLEMYYLGITAGTSPTTYSPDATLTRGQAAVFVSKGVNQAIARSSRRAALGQWWTTMPRWTNGIGTTETGGISSQIAADGADIWVPSSSPPAVFRIRASDGRLLEQWSGPDGATISAMGRIYAARQLPAQLYEINPALPAGVAALVAPDIGPSVTQSLAFDGSRLWATACCALTIPPTQPPPGSVSIVTPGTWTVSTITEGFDQPYGIVFDGTHIWVTDIGASAIFELDGDGAILRSIVTAGSPGKPTYDGENVWVPTGGAVLVVRASTGEIVATINSEYVGDEAVSAFDGQRVMVASSRFISLMDAGTLRAHEPIEFDYGLPLGIASDGINFWLALWDPGKPSVLARF